MRDSSCPEGPNTLCQQAKFGRGVTFSKLPEYVLICQAAERGVLRLLERSSAFLCQGWCKASQALQGFRKTSARGPGVASSSRAWPHSPRASLSVGCSIQPTCLFRLPAGIFFGSSSLSLAWWAGGKTALGFARRRLRWSINERCSPPPAVFGRVPRWEGWQPHGARGEVLRERPVVETQRSRHRSACLGNWLHSTPALESGNQRGTILRLWPKAELLNPGSAAASYVQRPGAAGTW